MKHTIKSIILLAAILIGGAGQAWAIVSTEPDLGKIVYTQSTNDHGSLAFYKEEACTNRINTTLDGFAYSFGLTSVTVKDGSGETVIGYKVYIKATPDLEYTLGAADEGGKVTFIKAEVTVETNVAGARTRGTATTVGVGDFIDVTATTTTGVYCMTMPADKNLNLLVTATFVEKPMNTAAISYIDADGESKSKDAETVYILDGTETTLGRSGSDPANNNKSYETWYVCNTAVDTEHPYGLAYDHGLALYGNVHLILADGCKMTVTNSSGNAINSINEIAIHGQSTGNNAGSLIAEGSQYGIYASGNITISGGQVTASGTNQSGINSQAGTAISINSCIINATGANYGIYASGNITISGGQVTASGTNQSGINSQAGTAISIINSIINATGAKYGIYGSCSEITISGGAVTATGTSDGGIYCGPGKISITDCNVTATGGSYGIYASGKVIISGEQVEAVATGTSGSGIESGSASNISITDCEVNAEGGNNGIKGGTDVTINGGKVTANGTSGSGIESGSASGINITGCEVNATGGSYGIKGGSAGVTISGGQVEAKNTGSNGYGIYSGINGITLGWTNATDYIWANSYNGIVSTATGKRFMAYAPSGNPGDEGFDPSVTDNTANFIVSGSSDNNFTLAAIAGKTLKPTTVTLNEGNGNGDVITLLEGETSITVASLTYNRTLDAPTESNKDVTIGTTPAKLYTTCLPTTPTTNDNVKYYTLASVSDNTLNFEEVTSPVADKPYLMAVIGNSNIPEQVTGSNVTLKKIVTGTPVDGYTMMGTQTGLSNADAISAANGSNVTYILQAQSTWGKVTNKAGVYIPPFRAFIVGPAVNTGNAARQLNSSFDDDDATGIDSIRTIDSDGTERWYDLNGRRIDKPTSTQKGVYIQSGRKVVVK